MVRRADGFRVQISAGGCVIGALMLLVLPLNWLIAAFLAAAVHELCHIAAVKLCGGEVRALGIGQGGALIAASSMTPGRALICTLAGPVGGLSLLFFARWLPRTAMCALIQSAYNLLPIYPLDGGRALRCGAILALPGQFADRICSIIDRICKVLLSVVALWLTLRFDMGILPLMILCLILLQAKKAKSSCKPGHLAVQ